jgi:iron(III) transport system ATP-binding protein
VTTIRVSGVDKSFDTTSVLAHVDLVVPNESITAVVGASGSGKTTLLRLIAGFEQVDAGSITIGDVVVDDGSHFEKAEHRGVGYVPQEGALFPHLNVARNIAFGVPRKDRGHLGDLVDLVGLSGLESRYPHQLSGGQQQRVALARALAIRPAVVLLDEPFSSLDATLRVGMGRDVVRVLKKSGTTAVLVTHDQDEALALADQIAVLRDGRVKACADPRSLYYDPPDLEIAASIGEANVVPARMDGDRVRTALGPIRIKGDGAATTTGESSVLLRPEQLVLHVDPHPDSAVGTVDEVQFHGHDALVLLTLDSDRTVESGQQLLARAPGDLALAPGQPVWIEVLGYGKLWATSH